MADKKQPPNSDEFDDNDDDFFIEEEVVTYVRKRRLFKFYCSLDNCPYCLNKPLKAKHPSKKWCCEDARAEFRRRERAREAIENQRSPGVVGKPAELDNERMGIFYIHALDKPKRLDGTNIYRVGSSKSWSEYEEQFLADDQVRNSFDAAIITMVHEPEVLVAKIVRKNEDKQQEDGLFFLPDPDLRIAHQIVIEHIEAYDTSEELQ